MPLKHTVSLIFKGNPNVPAGLNIFAVKPKLRIGLCYERKYDKIVVKHGIFFTAGAAIAALRSKK